MRCEAVVTTVYGRSRCTNEDAVQRSEPIVGGVGRNLVRELGYLCPFHFTHRTSPQCVYSLNVGSLRCMDVATSPAENPQICDTHRDIQDALERERVARTRRAFECLEADPRPTIEIMRDILREDPPAPAPAFLEEMDMLGTVDLAEARRQFEAELIERDPEAQRILGRRAMPQVTFSQTALPFVASLVQRLGGEVTVPARRLERGETLRFDRVSAGLRLRLMMGDTPIRFNTTTQATEEHRPVPPVSPAPEVVKKYEVEKVVDEQEAELRKNLLKCEECGLQFERTLEFKEGRTPCPYCEIRALEGKSATGETAQLRDSLAMKDAVLVQLREELSRLQRRAATAEEMLQQKLMVLNEKMATIRDLREQLSMRGLPTEYPSESVTEEAHRVMSLGEGVFPSRSRRILEHRRANPNESLQDAIRIVDEQIRGENRQRR